jgi:Na+/proline symporter
MDLAIIDWVIIAAYMIISLGIGLWYTKKASGGLNDFFLGGRNLTWWVAGVSMVATTFAADTPLAVTELVSQSGIAGNWLWWNFLLGGMLTTFFFAKLWRRANILTDVEFIELRYSGKEAAFLRGFRSVYLGLFMNSLIIGWVNVALISILQVFFNIPAEDALLYTGAAMLITVIYSSLSGLLGVAITDFVQFIIAMTGCIVLAIIVVNSEKIGGIDGLKEKLPSWSMDFFPTISSEASGTGIAKTLTLSIGTFLAYTTIQWWASWYPGAEPGGGGYIAQRMMSTKNEKHAFISTLFFQIAHYAIRPWPWILVGLCSIVLYPELGYADKKLGYVMAMKEFLPAGFKGLLLVAFLAAYMSTISTQLNWGASYLINDFYKRFMKPSASEKQLVNVSRIATVLMMLVALFATSQITSISGVWSFIIECGAGLGLVLILRWYWWRINAWSEITATIAPFIAFAFSKYFLKMQFPESFFVTVAFTTIAWITVTFLTQPVEKKKLDDFYKLIKPQGAWEPIRLGLGFEKQKSSIGLLFVCWVSSIIMCYSILFLFGKIIFKEWTEVLIYFTTGMIAFVILFITSRKVKIFEE